LSPYTTKQIYQTYKTSPAINWQDGQVTAVAWRRYGTISRTVCESIERFVPHKVLRKNSDPEYYNKEIKRLKSKFRKAYNKRKLGGHCTGQLKQLSKQLLAAKKTAQETFLKSILSKECKCWPEFYKYVRRRKGNRETIFAIKDCNGRIITDPVEKPARLISIIRQYSAARAIFRTYRLKTHVTLSPLILKQLGEGLRRSGKTNH
jgi:hypothetical protein